MTFKKFAQLVEVQYVQMSSEELFMVDIAEVFDSYLAAFPEGTNPLYRERTANDCNCCKNFVRNLGKVISFNDDGTRNTVWDMAARDLELGHYREVAERMKELMQQAPILSVYRTKELNYGGKPNWDNHDSSIKWDHFWGNVGVSHRAVNPDEVKGRFRSKHQVLGRGLKELVHEDLQTVLDLIDQNAIYRGEESRNAIVGFQKLQKAWLECDNQEAFVWQNLSSPFAEFRNTSIGTLFQDMASGDGIETAVKKFEAKVAPQNYKRPTALVTPKMIEKAFETLEELHLRGAVERRHARIEDISVNNVLFVDNAVQSKMKDSLLESMLGAAKRKDVQITHGHDIKAGDFFKDVLPGATSIDLLVEPNLMGNFVSLTAPVEDEPGKLFKWDNNFAWSYDGDVTDSLKERVKAAGGKVDALLRISLGWSNRDDLDLHVYTPSGAHIFFGDKQPRTANGHLDVDIIYPDAGSKPVENVYFNRLIDGEYRVKVNNYSRRGNSDTGFDIEFECDGRLVKFTSDKSPMDSKTIDCFKLNVRNGQIISVFTEDVKMGSSNQEKWNVKTGQLVPVDTVMFSPNYWDDKASGNRHYFFMLKGCLNPEPVRGIYNEFLREDLAQHRKVFEMLGSKTKAEYSDRQLSGLGFSSTKPETVKVVVDKKMTYHVHF